MVKAKIKKLLGSKWMLIFIIQFVFTACPLWIVLRRSNNVVIDSVIICVIVALGALISYVVYKAEIE